MKTMTATTTTAATLQQQLRSSSRFSESFEILDFDSLHELPQSGLQEQQQQHQEGEGGDDRQQSLVLFVNSSTSPTVNILMHNNNNISSNCLQVFSLFSLLCYSLISNNKVLQLDISFF